MIVLSSDQKGAIAETAAFLDASRLGLEVFTPISAGGRCDFILGIDDELVRVQCKWATRKGDVIVVRCYSSRRSATGFVRRSYSPREVDALVAYCPELDRCYFLPMNEFGTRREIRLRLGPTRNKQRVGVHWASDYEFAAKLARPGAVAQLGERVAGSHEVRGSIPLGSIDSAA